MERSRRVAEFKEHDGGLVGPSMANERGFPFVTFLDPYVVISPMKVYLCEVLRSFELVDELRDKQERVIVPYGMFI